MVRTLSIVRRLSAPISGLALTWFVVRMPGEYAYASVWLMPTLAAFFAFATWFAFAYRSMAPRMALAWKVHGPDQQRHATPGMADVFDSVAWVCMGVGILSALIQTVFSPTHCSWEMPFAVGVGIFVGVKALRKISV